MPIAIACTNEEKVLVTSTPKTAKGRVVALDGPITVSVTSGFGTFEMVSDLSFWAISSDDLGVTEYKVDGVSKGNPLSDTASLTVSEAGAASLDLTSEAPVLK